MRAGYFINGDILTVIFPETGQTHSIRPSHQNYDKIKQAVFASWDFSVDKWNDLFNPAINVASSLNEYNPHLQVELKGGYIYYQGLVLNNYLTGKILEFKEKELPYKPLVRFLENLLLNPSKECIDWLYPFLENRGMALTEDGCFMGYKGVNENYSSISHLNGRNGNPYIVSKPETSVRISRHLVDDNRSRGCSNGLHVGSYRYALDYAGGRKIILVKVNPKDCVSVPSYEEEKLRCCEYFVVKDITKPLEETLYREENKTIEDDDDDYDYEDESYDYEDENEDSPY